MRKRSILLLVLGLLLVLCSCKTMQFDIAELEISVFEDYDSLISIDNSKLKLVDMPIDRIIVCKKGEQVYGYFTGNFPKNIAKTALKKVETEYVMNVVSSGLIEFCTEGTEKPQTVLDIETSQELKTRELYVVTKDISSVPLGDVEIPEVFLAVFNCITVYGTGDKLEVIIDIKEASMIKTLYIIMKAGLIVNAQNAGKEIDVSNIATLIEQVDNKIILHNVDFNVEDMKNNFSLGM